jgi:hypothetical protein
MFFIKAPDKETFETILLDAGWIVEEVLNEDGTVLNPRQENFFTSGRSLDVIGVYQRQVGEGTLNEETGMMEYTYEDVEGYHANLLLHGDTMPEDLWQYVLDGKEGRGEPPASPTRVFA